jgi:hypothetical protein
MVKTGKVGFLFFRPKFVRIENFTWQGFHELEEEKLNGQKLQGPQTALELHTFLSTRGDTVRRPGGYPLLEAVWRICYEVGFAHYKLDRAESLKHLRIGTGA